MDRRTIAIEVARRQTRKRDDAKLDRVRELMRDRSLDALVVRAPDNVLYLSNFWGMKGYDAVVFPLEGEPTLVCLEPSRADAYALVGCTVAPGFEFRGFELAPPGWHPR